MTREIHDIPPAPRRVRWRAVLWHWFPLAFMGFLFGVYGGLITLMFFLAWGGKPQDDELLDREGVVVTGMITKIEGGNGPEPIRLSYLFTTEKGQEFSGRAFLDRPEGRVDDDIQIEYAPSKPHKSRPLGGRIGKVPRFHSYSKWILLTGLLCAAIWFTAVLRLRRLMVHGDIAVAEVEATEPVGFVQPTTVKVRYSYRDHRAQQQSASHWVRARSALGNRLATNPKKLAVLHDRSNRGVSRLVIADDFVVELGDGHDASRDDNRDDGRERHP